MNVARRPLQQTLYNREPGYTVQNNPLLSSGSSTNLPALNVAPKPIISTTPKGSSSDMSASEAAQVIAPAVSSGGFTGAGAGAGAAIGGIVGGPIGAAVGAGIGTVVGSVVDMFMGWDDAEKQNAQIRQANELALKEKRREEKVAQKNLDRQRQDELEAQNFNRGLSMASRLRESMFSTPDFQNRLINIQKGRR